MKVFIGIVSIVALALAVRVCMPLLTPFDVGCDETHRSVTLMRSLSQEQLSALHSRISELSKKGPDDQIFSSRKPFIPDDLKYLDAFYIRLWDDERTLVVLTKCTYSIGITLFVEHPPAGGGLIELKWPAPTDDNPYNEDTEILWTSSDKT